MQLSVGLVEHRGVLKPEPMFLTGTKDDAKVPEARPLVAEVVHKIDVASNDAELLAGNDAEQRRIPHRSAELDVISLAEDRVSGAILSAGEPRGHHGGNQERGDEAEAAD